MARAARGPLLAALSGVVICSATDRPVIGILTVPTDSECVTALEGRQLSEVGGGSCFNALYVKYLEAAGARVVPLFYDAGEAELAQAFSHVNGVLFTGGEVPIADPSGPAEAKQFLHTASVLFNLTVAANDAGIHVPLWGTCMGFQTLNIIAAGSQGVLTRDAFDSDGLSMPLNYTGEAADSRLLGSAGPLREDVRDWLAKENLTSNLHHDGVEPSAFVENARLAAFFKVLSTNVDRKGRPFVSTIESRRYPIYGVQWHPERPAFSWDDAEHGINHGAHAVEAMQYFANFLVAESRKNSQHFPSASEERAALVYNYVPQGHDSFQSYIFPPARQSGGRALDSQTFVV